MCLRVCNTAQYAWFSELKHAKILVWSFKLTWFCVLYLERNVLTVGPWGTGHNHLSQWLTFTTCAPFFVPDCWHFPSDTGNCCSTIQQTQNYSWLIRIRGSHEEALGFHGTLLRIDPPLTGCSLIKDTNTECEILPVVTTVSQVMRPQDPWWSAGSLWWLSTIPLCPKYEKSVVFFKRKNFFKNL